MARNRVNTIQSTLPNSIPNLTTLVLTSNNFAELADLDILGRFSRLTHLSLLENPVARKEVRIYVYPLSAFSLLSSKLTASQHYRHWIIWRCPTVRFLDYQKVKDVERAKATELFGTAQEPSALASKVRLLQLLLFPLHHKHQPLLHRSSPRLIIQFSSRSSASNPAPSTSPPLLSPTAAPAAQATNPIASSLPTRRRSESRCSFGTPRVCKRSRGWRRN